MSESAPPASIGDALDMISPGLPLPRSGAIIAAFRGTVDGSLAERLLLVVAAELAVQHQQQWQAEDTSRAPDAPAAEVAAAKCRIDALNARRVALIERIDAWAARTVPSQFGASLHTETLGSVVDRLGIAWVRTNNASRSMEAGAPERARRALRQFAELAQAYDDLVCDLAAGQRRLPAWRPLKCYRNSS
jgi:hypothetical protein